MKHYNYYLKIGIIGKRRSGKSSLITKYLTGKFDEIYHQTIYVQVHSCNLASTHGELHLQFYEITCDQFSEDSFPSIVRKMNGCIIMIDGSEESIDEMLFFWYSSIISINKNIPLLGLINKQDLMNENQFKSIPKMNFPLFTISLKNSINYQIPFVLLVQMILSLPILFSSYILRLENNFG